MSTFTKGCRFFLARETGPSQIELLDGCHGSPEGVAEAAKLHHRIFGHEGPWIMVELHPVPEWGDVEINEDAATTCAQLVSGTLPPPSQETDQ